MFSSAARSSGFVRHQAGKASAAAAAAASTWATDASGAWPTTSSVAGLTIVVGAAVAVDPLAADEELEPRCCHAGETRTRSRGDAYRGSQITTGMSRSVRFWYPA